MSNQLYPAWFSPIDENEGQISDLTLVDSLETVLGEIKGIGLLLHTYANDENFNSVEAVDGASLVLCNRVKEMEALIELWHSQRRTAHLRTVDGGES